MSEDAKPIDEKVAKTKKSRASKRKEVTGAVVPWKFPKNGLEEAIKVAKGLDEKFGGNPTAAEDLVKAVGFNKANDWRFQDLLRSAALYGITSGSGPAATVRMEKLGEDIIAPGSSDQRQKALLAAFRNVADFAAVEDFY